MTTAGTRVFVVTCDHPDGPGMERLTEHFYGVDGSWFRAGGAHDILIGNEPAVLNSEEQAERLGSETRLRHRLECDCGLNLTANATLLDEVLERLADGGVSSMGLSRLCRIVSNWR